MKAVLGVAALAALVPGPVSAQCSITATPVSFGTYLPFAGTATDSTGNVTIRCRLVGPYTIALNDGLYGLGHPANRRMGASGAYLSYQLYTNATRSTVWGDGAGGSVTAFGLCNGYCNNSYNIYGRIPARQMVKPGTYTDTITVTVVF